MDLSFAHFFEQMSGNPLLTMAVILTLGVILVNGWTDAPNAIATCVVTRCMPPKAALLMAAVFNFLGVFVMTLDREDLARISHDIDEVADCIETIVMKNT